MLLAVVGWSWLVLAFEGRWLHSQAQTLLAMK